MKIAILGTRGIPARYSGFETFAEQLSLRLVEHGHKVTVYCRRPFTRPDDVVDPRIRRVILPTISQKFVDTLSHTFLSVLHVAFTDADVVLVCNVANSPLVWIPRLFGKPTVLNVDGLDRKRRKWNVAGRLFLHFCEMVATITPTRVVTDAKHIQEYYWKRYRCRSTAIFYGAEVPPGDHSLQNPGLTAGKFILYVSRLEPENNPELVLQAYRDVATDWPLVMVGGNMYDPAYVQRLKSMADPRVIFTGGVYGEGYWQLQKNAGLYVCACEVGGVHPALIEAMVAENAVLYLDNPENRETAGDAAVPFKPNPEDLAAAMKKLVSDEPLRREFARKARERAETCFSWEETTRKYEELFREVAAPKKRSS